ncbi:MAG: hypothetical protein ABR902_13485 [Candidatus Korobacteraceae bacterium]|jgi:hypothetical protein
MAVTIDEMHVQVQGAPAAASSSSSSEEPKKDVNLGEALQTLHERNLRLRAD